MPIDSKLEDEYSHNFEMTSLDDALASLGQARGIKILVLDACRRNSSVDQLAGMVAKTCPAGFVLDDDGDCGRQTEHRKTAARPAESGPSDSGRERSVRPNQTPTQTPSYNPNVGV